MSFCPQGGGGIPACLAGQSRGLSQHALRVSLGGVWSWGDIFRGGLQFGGLQFLGGSPIFWGSPIFGGRVKGGKGDPQFFWGGNFFVISALWGYTLPPPGPDTGIRSTFGRYASYWNAFLYNHNSLGNH